LFEGWIVLSILLYVLIGAFWLSGVWIQMRMRDLVIQADAQGAQLPQA
jgi:uncharacterized membrane protein